ncbi:MAG TPA: VOC family protein [Steroidobacteraceae bacterium]|nr:VOC family protein [Steroidobacteraceae bacterium]
MASIRVSSIGHTGITVSDLDRSIHFYREVLGFAVSAPVHCTGEMFERVTGVPGAEIDVSFVRAPGHVIELLCYRKPEGRVRSTLRSCDPGFWHLALKVSDIERVVQSVWRAGFEPLSPVQGVGEGPLAGLKVVYVRDPDGVVLELLEEPPGVVLEELYLANAR